jgi:hypothetical protein
VVFFVCISILTVSFPVLRKKERQAPSIQDVVCAFPHSSFGLIVCVTEARLTTLAVDSVDVLWNSAQGSQHESDQSQSHQYFGASLDHKLVEDPQRHSMAILLKLHKLCKKSHKCHKYYNKPCEDESIPSVTWVLFSGPIDQTLLHQIRQRTQKFES